MMHSQHLGDATVHTNLQGTSKLQLGCLLGTDISNDMVYRSRLLKILESFHLYNIFLPTSCGPVLDLFQWCKAGDRNPNQACSLSQILCCDACVSVAQRTSISDHHNY